VARKVIRTLHSAYEVVAYVRSIHDLDSEVNQATVTTAQVDATPVRCPDLKAAEAMIARIKEVRSQGDSIGGIIECVVRGVPNSLGEPVFDKLEADLAKAMMSLPATKGFEIGSGFAGTRLTGSEHNDAFVIEEGKVSTATNRSGGIQGGISNGEHIFFRVAFKPTATIAKIQQTVTVEGEAAELAARGRHDACVLPRAVPMVEAMVHLVLCDHLLRQHGQNVLP
jgi:chorismate synthase